MSDKELLNFAIQNGIIDINTIQKKFEMNERKKYLEMHEFKIWQGSDGKWRTYLPDKEKGRVLRKRNSLHELENIIVDFWKGESENPTIQEVFTEWNDRRLNLKKISESTHLRNTQIFNRHYSEFGKQKIKSIRKEDYEDFLEEQIPNHKLTGKAFSNLKSITRGFLKRAKKRKLIDFNVEELFQELDVSDIDFRKVVKEDYEEVFDEEEMPLIMEYLENNSDIMNLGILLMFVTGIRIGEMVVLKHEVFCGNSFKIRRTETRYKNEEGKYVCEVKEYPKTDAGVRTVVIPDRYMWIAEKLRLNNPFGEFIFVKADGTRITTQCVRMRLKRVCKKLGVYHKSPHKIRKTYGTILLDNNIDNQLIIGQMGHSDILCTETHYHRNRKSIDKKRSVISSIPEFR